jgi:hypothetical protein
MYVPSIDFDKLNLHNPCITILQNHRHRIFDTGFIFSKIFFKKHILKNYEHTFIITVVKSNPRNEHLDSRLLRKAPIFPGHYPPHTLT